MSLFTMCRSACKEVPRSLVGNPVSRQQIAAVALANLALWYLTRICSAADVMTPNDLLAILRAKDGQFDNVRFDYVASGELKTRPFPASKLPDIAKRYGWEHEKASLIPFSYDESLILRGPNVTFIRKAVIDTPAPASTHLQMVPFQKWSNAKGVARELTKHDNNESLMSIEPGGLKVDLAQEQAMWVEFAHGFGFGKKLKEISRIAKNGPQWELDGTIQIWSQDVSRCTLVLDDRYIVRKAHIECDVHGACWALDSSSDGTTEDQGFVIAKKGTFKRTSLGRKVNGELKAKPTIVKQFEVSFRGISFNLDDKTYEELIEIAPAPGTTVFDHIADKTYVVGWEAEARPLRPKPASGLDGLGLQESTIPGKTRSRSWIIAVNAVALLGVALALMWFRRRKPET